MIFRLYLCSLLLVSTGVAAPDDNTFTNAPFSLKISAPRTWKLLPSDFPAAAGQLAMPDKSLQDYLKQHPTVPIVSIAKPVEGAASIVPALQIFAVPSKGRTSKAFLYTLFPVERRAFEDYEIVQDAHDTTLNGMNVASMETSYTAVYPGNLKFPVAARKWAVPRGDILIIISLTGPPDALKALKADIDFILGSIRFTDQ